MSLLKYIFAFCFLSAAHTVWAADQARASYIGKLLPELTQCHEIDGNRLVSGGDSYVLTECDTRSTNKSIRIFRVRVNPNSAHKYFELISGEIILPWKPIKFADYFLAQCKEKDKDTWNAGVYIGMGNTGALDANDENALAFFAERDNGAIEKIPFSKIDECDYAQGE